VGNVDKNNTNLKISETLIINLTGAFAKSRKAKRCFVMSVCPSVGMEQLGSHWTSFHEIWIIRKPVPKNQGRLNMTIITGTVHEDV